MKLRIQKLHEDAITPQYALDGDAGMDIFSMEHRALGPGERARVLTGIAMEIPYGYVGLIWEKSGLAVNHGIQTMGGVIDSGYRGEVVVTVYNASDTVHTFEKGDKVGQMLIQKVESPGIEVVDTLSESERGEAGFGSTGK